VKVLVDCISIQLEKKGRSDGDLKIVVSSLSNLPSTFVSEYTLRVVVPSKVTSSMTYSTSQSRFSSTKLSSVQ